MDAIEDFATEISESAELVDSDGVVFNPDLHSTDKEGNPSTTKAGRWRKKKGASTAPKVNNQSKQLGIGLTALTEQLGTLAFGDDGVMNEPEKEGFTDAYTRLCEQYEINDIPPAIALALVGTMYTIPRLTKTAKDKNWWEKAKLWIATRKKEKSAKKESTEKNESDESTSE